MYQLDFDGIYRMRRTMARRYLIQGMPLARADSLSHRAEALMIGAMIARQRVFAAFFACCLGRSWPDYCCGRQPLMPDGRIKRAEPLGAPLFRRRAARVAGHH